MTGLTVLASGKGGVGKTFLAVSLAHALTHLGRRVLLVDADLGLANIDVQLGFDGPLGLGRAIAAGLDPATLVQDRGGGLWTLTGAGTGQGLDRLPTARLEDAVERLAALATTFDEVLVDLPSGLERVGPAFIGKAKRLLLVGSNEPTSLTDNYALVKLTRGAAPRPLFVANAVADAAEGRAAHATLARACRHFLDLDCLYLGAVRRDRRVPEAIRRQMALCQRSPQAPAAADIAALASRLLAETPAG
ncbi:MAG: cellulose synthase operon protein YhjQ/BcsQ [Geminicoccaceae bacterium]